MTISSTVRIAGPFIGTGTATVFPFAFKVFAASNLQVVRADSSTGLESTLILNTDYTVSLNTDQDSNPGGNVTLLAVLAVGFTMVITSDIANLQPTDLTNQGGFYPEVITDALDRATIQIQQMADELTRSIKIPISDGLSLDMELPTAAARANSFLAFDATGEPTVVTAGSSGAPTTITRQQFSGTGSQVAFTLASDPGALGNSCEVFIGGIYQQRDTYTIAGTTLTFTAAPVAGTDNIEVVNFLTSAIGTTDSSLVTFVPAGSGATMRTAQAKFRDVVSVKDFGAVGDGTTNDTAAIQAAFASGAGQVLFPIGTYRLVANSLATPTIQMTSGAMISVDSGYTLTLSGGLIAPISQIFTGVGTVTFGTAPISCAYPEWFGAVGNGTTNDSAAIQKAIDAFPITVATGGIVPSCVSFQNKSYGVSSEVVMRSGLTLKGSAESCGFKIGVENSAGLRLLSSNANIVRIPEGCTFCTIKDLGFYCYTGIANYDIGTTAILAKPVAYYADAVFPPSSYDHKILNCVFWGFNKAIQFLRADKALATPSDANWQIDFVRIDGCRFQYFRTNAIYVATTNFDLSHISKCSLIALPLRTTYCRSIELERHGNIQISDCAGAYIQPAGELVTDPSALSSMIYYTSYHDSLIVQNCQNEQQPRFIDSATGSGTTLDRLTLIGNTHDHASYFQHPQNVKIVGGIFNASPSFIVTSSDVNIEDAPAGSIETTGNGSTAYVTHEIDNVATDYKRTSYLITDATVSYNYQFPIIVNKYIATTSTTSLIQVKYIPITHRFFSLNLQYSVVGAPTYTISVKYKTVNATNPATTSNINLTLASNAAPVVGSVITHRGYAVAVAASDSVSWIEVQVISNTANAVYIWADLNMENAHSTT
jgi:hypothetical protein